MDKYREKTKWTKDEWQDPGDGTSGGWIQSPSPGTSFADHVSSQILLSCMSAAFAGHAEASLQVLPQITGNPPPVAEPTHLALSAEWQARQDREMSSGKHTHLNCQQNMSSSHACRRRTGSCRVISLLNLHASVNVSYRPIPHSSSMHNTQKVALPSCAFASVGSACTCISPHQLWAASTSIYTGSSRTHPYPRTSHPPTTTTHSHDAHNATNQLNNGESRFYPGLPLMGRNSPITLEQPEPSSNRSLTSGEDHTSLHKRVRMS